MRIAQLSDLRRSPLPLEEGEVHGRGVVKEPIVEDFNREPDHGTP
jgi:hypothetical protein